MEIFKLKNNMEGEIFVFKQMRKLELTLGNRASVLQVR